jgi:transposase
MKELNDEQWKHLEALLPKANGKNAKGGRPRVSDRKTLNGILWVMYQGEQWSKIPPKYGAYVTCWRRYREWEESGVWSQLWQAYFGSLERGAQTGWMVAFLDGHFVPGRKV